MVRKIAFIVCFCLCTVPLFSQISINVQITNTTRENLNLQAVASLFGQCRTMEEFEYQLNNPDNQLSNLDLNHDGYVDYIRVMDVLRNGQHTIYLQDVIGQSRFENLARLIVERDYSGRSAIWIIGNEQIYGENYILQPEYSYSPVLFQVIWQPSYRIWISPYYWRHYPPIYHPWHPMTAPGYRQHIEHHISPKVNYRRRSAVPTDGPHRYPARHPQAQPLNNNRSRQKSNSSPAQSIHRTRPQSQQQQTSKPQKKTNSRPQQSSRPQQQKSIQRSHYQETKNPAVRKTKSTPKTVKKTTVKTEKKVQKTEKRRR